MNELCLQFAQKYYKIDLLHGLIGYPHTEIPILEIDHSSAVMLNNKTPY